MARGKLSMRYIKEILRLKYEAKLSQRDIAHSVRVSVGSVNQYLTRAAQADIGWPLPEEMDQKALVRALFPDQQPTRKSACVPSSGVIPVLRSDTFSRTPS